MVDISGGNDDTNCQWVLELIGEERSKYEILPKAVFDRLEVLLRDEMADQALTPAKLKSLANQLLGDLVHSSPEEGEGGED